MEEPLKDFLTDISANYKIDKYHLKMQRKNQFVKISFYELVLFWSVLIITCSCCTFTILFADFIQHRILKHIPSAST